ncbi:unnamed protein product [Phytomonas sp. EM1]|nr:unnamed protein product [Phytomonas sp. EM1]|eukprot:CCW61699.1 unnamed protein product [Phytomonas sp. isolate EM1]
MDESPHPDAFKTSWSCADPFVNTRLPPCLQQLLLCYGTALASSDPLSHSAASGILPAIVVREPAAAQCSTGASVLAGSTMPAISDTSPPLPSSAREASEEDAADQARITWRHFMRLHCLAPLGYSDVSEVATDVSHPGGYQSWHLNDVRRMCGHFEQSSALWNLLRNHPSDAAYGLSFAHGLVQHLGLLRRVSPEEFLLESSLPSEGFQKWYIGRTVGAKTSKPTHSRASSGMLPCPCGCVRGGTIADRMAFQFHSTYYKIHNPSEDPYAKWKAEEFLHPQDGNEGVGSAVFQESHRAASLQIVSLPVLTVQILANFVQSIQSRYVPHSLGPRGLQQASSQPLELHPQEAYRSFFTLRERRVVVIACALLAWKQLDMEADAFAFVLSEGPHAPGPTSSSSRSREQQESDLPMMSEVASDQGVLNSFTDFRCFCSHAMITSFSRSPVDEIHEMEEYVFANLKCCVGAPPLWWRVAVEMVQHYYYGVRLKGQYALNCFCHHVDSAAAVELRQHYQYAMQRLVNRAIAFLLLPTFLDIADGDETKNAIRHSDPPIAASLQDEYPTQRCSGANIDSSRGTADSKTLMTLRRHMMFNPLLGFGLAIHCDAITFNWALSFITLRPSLSSLPDDQSTARSNEVQDVNRDVASQLRKICGEIQSWFDAVNIL